MPNARSTIPPEMNTHKRQIFLEHFLALYGVDTVEITGVGVDKIFGVAHYMVENENQEFCWYMTEDNTPSDDLIELIDLIKENKFNLTDQIIATEDEIFEKSRWADRIKFDSTYYKLFSIEVKMIDDGEETDSYFIHD
jgi:hypothetical protein